MFSIILKLYTMHNSDTVMLSASFWSILADGAPFTNMV